MFIGEYEHALDGKNRVNVPAKFREALDAVEGPKGFYITRGLDTCLFLYAPGQWEEVAAALRAKSFTDSAARMFKRHFFSNASYTELDNQGRILIPENLKSMAQLSKQVTIAGVDDRIEIWDRDRWKGMKDSSSSEYEMLAEKLF